MSTHCDDVSVACTIIVGYFSIHHVGYTCYDMNIPRSVDNLVNREFLVHACGVGGLLHLVGSGMLNGLNAEQWVT